MSAYAFESITVDAAAGGKGFTDGTINNGRSGKPYRAKFVVETAQMRFTVDGTAPTSSVGTLVEIGDVIEIIGEHDIETFRAIRTGAVSAVIQPTYFNGQGESIAG